MRQKMYPEPAADDEIVLTRRGYNELVAERQRLAEVKQPDAVARLREATEVAGDLSDNQEYLDARAELDRIEERIDVLDARLRAARLMRPREASRDVVSRGTRVVLEDLDSRTRTEYVVVASAEADPEKGRLSDESPVGKAICGHRKGDRVEARTPRAVRHLRIADVGGRGRR